MFGKFFNNPKSNPAESSNIYHLNKSEIRELKEKTAKDAEREKEERLARLAEAEAEREDTERVRRLLQQEEARNKGPYIITKEDREKAEKFIEKL